MSNKQKASLLGLGLFVAWISAWWIKTPGYMDADYYYATSIELASGNGLYEPFLWNYLDNPTEIPHAAFRYWLPITSLLATISQWIFGISFRFAQLPFIVLTAFLPIFTAWVAARLHEDNELAWNAGLLAAVPGFFLPFLVTTDSFSVYAFLGPLVFFAIVFASEVNRFSSWLLPGCLAGLCHLTRADGILFLFLGIIVLFFHRRRKLHSLAGILVGYFAILTPWWTINWIIHGSPLASGTARILWMTSYDELFTYPAEKLNPKHWIDSGLGNILLVRLEAFWANVKSLLFVNGVVFMSPFMIVGAWKQRRKLIVRLVFLYLVFILVLMSFIVPFAGSRGGFFHSSMAIMPILWALAPLGLKTVIEKGVQVRNWRYSQASSIFFPAFFILAALATLSIFWNRVVGVDYLNSIWSKSERGYSDVSRWLHSHDVPRSTVGVNNPPGFYIQSGFPSVVIPDGDQEALRSVTERFEVSWILLDSNHPVGLSNLYERPSSSDWLEVVATFDDVAGKQLFLMKVISVNP